MSPVIEGDRIRGSWRRSSHMSSIDGYTGIKEKEKRELKESINYNKCDTSLGVKREHFKVFSELIENQFIHGGDKYKLSEIKEFTDGICECFPGESGVDFILSTCMKYLGRYKNFGREKDLLKIATYMYICWLKGGFYLSKEHDEDTNKDGSKTNES